MFLRILGFLAFSFITTAAYTVDLAVLSSREFRHPPTTAHVRAVVQEVLREFQISDKGLPNLCVVFLTRSEADVQRLPKGHTIADRITRDGTVFYQIWIIDDATDAAVVDAVVTIVEHEVGSKHSPAELATITRRICTRMNSQVSVSDYREEH